MNEKTKSIGVYLILICAISVLIFVFAEPSFSQKELTNITIEHKWDRCYFSDSNDNTYVLYGGDKCLRYEKLELNHNYTIEVTSHYIYPSLMSHSEVKIE